MSVETKIAPDLCSGKPATPSCTTALVASGLLAIAALLALTVDVPLARWSLDGGCPRGIHEFLEVYEFFGHGGGVALIVVGIWLLDTAGRKRIPRIVAAVVVAGLSADLVKMCIGRLRPRDLNFRGGDVLDTFVSWFPLASNHSNAQSFPSAHTATAVALALALAWVYPRGRYLFAFMAAAVAIQRVECSAHFPSDVLAGATIGWLAGSYMLQRDALFGAMSRFETSFAARLFPIAADSSLAPAAAGGQNSPARRAA